MSVNNYKQCMWHALVEGGSQFDTTSRPLTVVAVVGYPTILSFDVDFSQFFEFCFFGCACSGKKKINKERGLIDR